jgi:hypothetical protein
MAGKCLRLLEHIRGHYYLNRNLFNFEGEDCLLFLFSIFVFGG